MRSFVRSVATAMAALIVFGSSTYSLFGQQGKRDQARVAVAEGDFTTAAKLYDDAVKESPKDKSVLLEAADVNVELDRLSVAQGLYERALDIDSKDPVVLRKYGLLLSDEGETTKAVEAIRRAMKYD